MAHNPLDDEGCQELGVGGRGSVTGEMDYGFLKGRELVAETVTTLKDRSG